MENGTYNFTPSSTYCAQKMTIMLLVAEEAYLPGANIPIQCFILKCPSFNSASCERSYFSTKYRAYLYEVHDILAL